MNPDEVVQASGMAALGIGAAMFVFIGVFLASSDASASSSGAVAAKYSKKSGAISKSSSRRMTLCARDALNTQSNANR